jgi:hypothetical protein
LLQCARDLKNEEAMAKPTKKAQRELREWVERAPKSHGAKAMAGWLRAERKRRREREQEHRPLAAGVGRQRSSDKSA